MVSCTIWPYITIISWPQLGGINHKTAPAIHKGTYTYIHRCTSSTCCHRRFHSYVKYCYDDSSFSTSTRLPFDYSRNTAQWFHSYHLTWFCGCLWRFWLCRYPSMNPQIPFDDSADTLWQFQDTLWWFCGYPLTTLWISFDNSADDLRITYTANPWIFLWHVP